MCLPRHHHEVSRWLLDAVAIMLTVTAGVSVYYSWFGDHPLECRRIAQSVLMFAVGGLFGWGMLDSKGK